MLAGKASAGRASVFSSKSEASGPLSPNSSVSGRKSRRTKSGTKDSGGHGSQESSSIGEDYLIAKEGSNSSDKFIVGVIGASLMIVQVVVLIIGLTSWLKVVRGAEFDKTVKYGDPADKHSHAPKIFPSPQVTGGFIHKRKIHVCNVM
ncbi:unnamed protein product [Cladocopium goreaui]|uniref:Uncharacterized protein n=1 Tax=Cladocopium goreaui TaxID=2562237 RepID=A0A9P1BYE2_9DINO|nr:unnamed protein product [Cladocopium goreaui]